MLPIILLIIAGIVVVFVIIVARQPGEYTVTRSATVAAPPAAVFAQVNDFHKWDGWSPWAKLDPAAMNSFTGAPAGTGAVFAWSGNNKIGQGRMTMTRSVPEERIDIDIAFVRPFKSTSTASFTFEPRGGQTVVTWSMVGRKNFISKAFCLFVNMDKMLGGEFEKGLSQMKTIAEAAARAPLDSSR